ncbi:MAG: TolC family protein [Pseudomonadota bacterium]|nr:TolC family protein [Pseudomonadota bacterium]
MPEQQRLNPISLPPVTTLRMLSLALCLAMPSASFALSLPQAQQQLNAQSWQLKAQALDAEAWQQQAAATQSLGLPRVDLTVAGIRYGKHIDIGKDLPIPVPLSLDIEREGIRSQINVMWPLSTGGKIQATQAQAQAKVAEVESDQVMTQAKLNKALVDRYFAVQLSQRALTVMQSAAATLDEHVYKAKRFEQEGMISRLSRIQAEVARDEIKRDLVETQAKDAVIRAGLASLLNVPASDLPCLTHPLPTPQPLKSALTDLLAQAEQHNPAFAKLQAKAEQAHQQLKIEQSAFKPEIFAVGSYDLNRRATPLTEPDWSVGIGAKWALTSGLDRRHLLRAATLRQQQVSALTAQTSADLRLGVEQAYRQAQQYQQQYTLLDRDLVLAHENARLQQRSFEAGLSTSLDATDARLGVARSEVQRYQAAYAYVEALTSLYELTGALHELEPLMQQLKLSNDSACPASLSPFAQSPLAQS